jgi:RimJ/RimL family protein N-acetyltransferase/predicted RNA-binding Zn-ribbon protein involved in translation (DUF1610 family)
MPARLKNTRTNAMITEESFIDFKCPYCGGPVSFPQTSAKSLQACPSCMEALIVPETTSEVGRKIPIPITTPRLILRRLRGGDWKDLLEFLSDAELPEFSDRSPMDEQEALRWLDADSFVKLTTPGQSFYLGIEFRDGGKLIGYVRLDFADPTRLQAWIHVVVSPSYQRNGVATEAVGALVDFCFSVIGLHRITAWHDSRNVPARGLCEKLGLRREGEFLKDRLVNEEWVNSVWYARLNEEYLQASGSLSPKSSA